MIRPSLVFIPQHFGALLFDRRSSRYLPFDRPAAAVLRDMTEHPAGDVIAASAPEDREAVEGLVVDLAARGYLRRAESNDAVRGQGVFDRVIEKLELLGRHARFTLAFTLTRNNIAEVEDCVELARRVGAHTAVFRPLYPVGIAARTPELMPSFEGYVDALSRLERVEADNDLFALDPFSPSAREDLRGVVTPGTGCGAANTVASISVQGDVNPCGFLGKAFESGNVRARPFEEIWREGHAFRRMRSGGGEDRFTGGCRARAQFYAGSAYAEDPWQVQARGEPRPERWRLPVLEASREGSCR